MENELLPIGTVVKIRNKYLAIIIGYFGYSHNSSQNLTEFVGDYEVSPYPFDCMNIKNDFKLFKKYDWFNFKLNVINKNDITDIIFMGYKDSEFEKMKVEFNK